MLVDWLVAFAKLTHCSAERTFCIRKIVRLLGGGIQKKENLLDFLSACPPRILAMRFYCYPLVLFSFTCYLFHSLGSRLVAFAKLTHCSAERTFFAWSKNRSLALCGSPKKEVSTYICMFITQNTRRWV